jgi:hypothetical protein
MAATSDEDQRVVVERDPADAGISMASVLVMLVVLAIVVIGVFWVLPAWFGSRVIEVMIRS